MINSQKQQKNQRANSYSSKGRVFAIKAKGKKFDMSITDVLKHEPAPEATVSLQI